MPLGWWTLFFFQWYKWQETREKEIHERKKLVTSLYRIVSKPFSNFLRRVQMSLSLSLSSKKPSSLIIAVARLLSSYVIHVSHTTRVLTSHHCNHYSISPFLDHRRQTSLDVSRLEFNFKCFNQYHHSSFIFAVTRLIFVTHRISSSDFW